MSDTQSQEPTMEEILASIRRIISEDEAPAGAGADAAPEEPRPTRRRWPITPSPRPPTTCWS